MQNPPLFQHEILFLIYLLTQILMMFDPFPISLNSLSHTPLEEKKNLYLVSLDATLFFFLSLIYYINI